MYCKLYKDIKARLAEEFGLAIDGRTGACCPLIGDTLQDIQWFNNQYDGEIHAAPAIFIEFSPLVVTPRTKQAEEVDIQVRLHVVSEVMNGADGDVQDADVVEHERIALMALRALEWCRFDFGEEGETRAMRLAEWSHNHVYNGWMVTLVTLKTKGQLP